MGEIVDLDRIMQEKKLEELKEDLPGINTAMIQLMIRLREDVELTHRLAGFLGKRTTKSAIMDGLEVEYTLENISLDKIRKIIALRFKGYDITKDVPQNEMGPYMMSALEVFLTEGGAPPKTYTAAPDGIIDVIGFYQDVVPLVYKKIPGSITIAGGF